MHPLDRALKRGHLASVRYADDFVVLAETRERAQFGLGIVEKQLRAMRLRLNVSKTRLASFSGGFTFLGVEFRGAECELASEGKRWVFSGPEDVAEIPPPAGYGWP